MDGGPPAITASFSRDNNSVSLSSNVLCNGGLQNDIETPVTKHRMSTTGASVGHDSVAFISSSPQGTAAPGHDSTAVRQAHQRLSVETQCFTRKDPNEFRHHSSGPSTLMFLRVRKSGARLHFPINFEHLTND